MLNKLIWCTHCADPADSLGSPEGVQVGRIGPHGVMREQGSWAECVGSSEAGQVGKIGPSEGLWGQKRAGVGSSAGWSPLSYIPGGCSLRNCLPWLGWLRGTLTLYTSQAEPFVVRCILGHPTETLLREWSYLRQGRESTDLYSLIPPL